MRFLCIILLSFSAFAQTPQIESQDVRRVASHIACRCGACKDTVSCPMSMSGCGFCTPAKARIFKMQKAGMTDKAIIDTFVKEYGPDSYRGDPSSFYWIVPYAVLALGALAMFWFVRRYYHPHPVTAAGPEDEGLSRYRDAIEKDMAKLE